MLYTFYCDSSYSKIYFVMLIEIRYMNSFMYREGLNEYEAIICCFGENSEVKLIKFNELISGC